MKIGAVIIVSLMLSATAIFAQSVSIGSWSASFSNPTQRYGHNVLGGTPEWGKLCLSNGAETGCETLPQSEVFEDIEPRLVDIDGDNQPEAVVVQSHADKGASLTIYDLENGKLRKTATPPIGTRFRWLAPVGFGDFNADGYIDLAYIDRPHLAKTLRVWTYRDGDLTQIATKQGLTNHKIGQAFISSGVRTCGAMAGPEMVTVDATWTNVVATRFEDGALHTRIIGPFNGPSSLQDALAC